MEAHCKLRIQAFFRDNLILLCQNEFSATQTVSIQGTISLILDNQKLLLINLQELLNQTQNSINDKCEFNAVKSTSNTIDSTLCDSSIGTTVLTSNISNEVNNDKTIQRNKVNRRHLKKMFNFGNINKKFKCEANAKDLRQNQESFEDKFRLLREQPNLVDQANMLLRGIEDPSTLLPNTSHGSNNVQVLNNETSEDECTENKDYVTIGTPTTSPEVTTVNVDEESFSSAACETSLDDFTLPLIPPKKIPKCRKKLSLSEKGKIVEMLDVYSMNALSKIFNVNKSQIRTVRLHRERIKDAIKNNQKDLPRCRKNYDGYEVNEMVFKWYKEAISRNITVNGPMLQSKAREFAHKLGLNNQGSHGWLDNFKKRHNIMFSSNKSSRHLMDNCTLPLISSDIDTYDTCETVNISKEYDSVNNRVGDNITENVDEGMTDEGNKNVTDDTENNIDNIASCFYSQTQKNLVNTELQSGDCELSWFKNIEIKTEPT